MWGVRAPDMSSLVSRKPIGKTRQTRLHLYIICSKQHIKASLMFLSLSFLHLDSHQVLLWLHPKFLLKAPLSGQPQSLPYCRLSAMHGPLQQLPEDLISICSPAMPFLPNNVARGMFLKARSDRALCQFSGFPPVRGFSLLTVTWWTNLAWSDFCLCLQLCLWLRPTKK